MRRQASRRGSNGRPAEGPPGTETSSGTRKPRTRFFRVGFYVLLKVCMALFLVWLAIQLIGVIVIWVTIAGR